MSSLFENDGYYPCCIPDWPTQTRTIAINLKLYNKNAEIMTRLH